MIKEFTLVHPKVACYVYSINEASNQARVTFEPLKGAPDYPKCTSASLAQAREHYEEVVELIERQEVKYGK